MGAVARFGWPANFWELESGVDGMGVFWQIDERDRNYFRGVHLQWQRYGRAGRKRRALQGG